MRNMNKSKCNTNFILKNFLKLSLLSTEHLTVFQSSFPFLTFLKTSNLSEPKIKEIPVEKNL